MIDSLQHLISQKGLLLESKEPFVVTVPDVVSGLGLAKDIVYSLCDKKTLLFLSGGRTPKTFYTEIAKEEKLYVGAVGIIDERYEESMHEASNELMLKQSGLSAYLEYSKTPFYSILQPNSRHSGKAKPHPESDSGVVLLPRMTLEKTALQYDETVRFLFNGFSKSIGILGIGLDGHTAGLPAGGSPDRETFRENKDQSLITYFTDFPGDYKERISMTFLGLSMLDIMLVLVFGEDKKQALQDLFSDGSEQEIPARFFKRPEIAQKTLLITDQRV